jgi:membrane-associated phospholipid phosphatase
LHAAVSVICFYTWYRYSKEASHASKALAIVTLIISAGVILSTLFIKQHYIADEIAGTLVAWCVGRSIFNYLWKSFKSAERADG